MKVLLLSPESSDCTTVTEWLRARGYMVNVVTTAADAMDAVASLSPRFVLVDLSVKAESLKFLRLLVTDQHAVWVVAIADRHDAAVTSEALRLGAVDIVPRPLHESDVIAALANAREVAGLAARSQPHDGADHVQGDGVVTLSPRMREVYELARRMAPSRCPVLIVGERGTGRETIARMIHHHGPLGDHQFWRISSGAAARAELREVATVGDGTIFVEELGDLPPEAQSQLAHIVGETREHEPSDGRPGFRVIAAAQPHIETLVDRRVVDRTLVDALSVLRLDLPTLRQRPQDIPALALYFLKEACQRNNITGKSFSRSALALFASLPWRGNAAELKTLVERLAVLVPRGVILQEDVLQHVRFDTVQASVGGAGTLRDARRQFEREFIASALQRHQWRMEDAAAELGMERTNLYRKMKQLGIVRLD